MVYDTIDNISTYRALPGIEAVMYFLANTDISSLPAGRTELGGGIYVNVNRYEPKETGGWEAHRNYIDLQYMVSGDEDMMFVSLADAEEPTPYAPDTDVCLFGGAKGGRAIGMSFTGGDFALFFPGDVHMPGLKNEKTAGINRKLVFKIPVEEYAHVAHVTQLADAIRLPAHAKDAVVNLANKITKAEAELMTKRYFGGEEIKSKIAVYAAEHGVSEQLYNLTVYMILAKQTYYNYLAKNISAEIYYDSMADITVWEKTCENKTGEVGLLQCGWIDNTVKEGLYKLGRFQYQPTTFGFGEYKVGDRILRAGDPIITIHIPEGEPLTDAVRYDSYRRAAAFFGENVFVCESWLLYPAHRDFLQVGSNIVRFMDDFTVLRSVEMRGDLSDLWRMYGYGCDHSDFASLPEQTGMQRAYKKHLLETGGMTGNAYGILVVDENGFPQKP